MKKNFNTLINQESSILIELKNIWFVNFTTDELFRNLDVFLMKFNVKCQANFYGPKCVNQCQISDFERKFSNFECDLKNGTKRCKSGWNGKNCLLGILIF